MVRRQEPGAAFMCSDCRRKAAARAVKQRERAAAREAEAAALLERTAAREATAANRRARRAEREDAALADEGAPPPLPAAAL